MSDFPLNIDVRGAVIGIIGLVPEVGGILSVFTTIFWPPDQPDYMTQVKSYVDQKITAAIDQAAVNERREEIEGLKRHLDDALAAKAANNIPQFNLLLSGAYGYTDDIHDKFTDLAQTDPQEAVVYLVAYGTLRLTIMRELYESSYDDSSRPAYRESIVSEINDLIPRVHSARAGAISWRQSQYYNYEASYHPPAIRLQDKLNDSAIIAWYYDEGSAARGLQNARDNVLYGWANFAFNLDVLLDPFRYWIFFDPHYTEKPSGHRMATYTRTGDFTSGFDTLFSTRDLFLANGPPIGIRISYNHDGIGLEVSYGDPNARTTAKMGQLTEGGDAEMNISSTTSLDIWGCSVNFDGSQMRGLWIGSGPREGMGPAPQSYAGVGRGPPSTYYDFTALAGEDSQYRLAYVTGLANDSGISQLTFVWTRPVDWDGEFNEDHQV